MTRAPAPAPLLTPAVLLVALLTVSACTSNDWGRCLASHEESRWTENGESETVTICDRWEYPGGVRP